MPAPNPARKLMSSFKELGLSAAQVRSLIPSWWADEVAQSEDGLLELQILLARRLNVSLGSLQEREPSPKFQATAPRFKTVHPDGSSQLAVAAGIGNGLAHLLSAAAEGRPIPLPVSAHELRAQLLKEGSAATLDRLVGWCWKHGLPIVHVTGWPNGLRRPDAMCMRVDQRPIVMVVRKETAPAKLAYLVAHELGHIMSGHLAAGQNAVLVDETLPVDAQKSFFDDDEKQADAYAIEVLGGAELDAAAKQLLGRPYSELSLAAEVLSTLKGKPLDAGQVILAWGRLTQEWKTANAALKYLQTMQAAPRVINDVARDEIDFDALSTDGMDHLLKLTAMELPPA